MSYRQALAAFASGLSFERLAPEVRQHARWILADTIGAIAGGSVEPELRALADSQSARGAATPIGFARHASADSAAFLNGTAGTFLEMDEGNRFARGHPAIHAVPAALAIAETMGTDADTFLAAVVVGYEVGARLAAASRLRASMHTHGTWGTIGAAAAAARAAGRGEGAMRNVLNIAASLTTATSKLTMLQGGLVRNVYAGLANRNGILALELDAAGFGGEADGLRTLFTSIVSDAFDPGQAIDGLGSQWQLMRNYFKLHACCRFNHGTLDALDVLAERGELPEPQDVEAVVVETYGLAAEMDNAEPANTLGAKFSIPFAVATRLHHGHSRLEAFTWEAVRDAGVLALARKVTVREDAAMSARLPDERPARVSVRRTDGRTVAAQVTFNRGDDAAPYGLEELAGKFLQLTGRVWPGPHCEALLEATLALGNAGTSFERWRGLLRRPA